MLRPRWGRSPAAAASTLPLCIAQQEAAGFTSPAQMLFVHAGPSGVTPSVASKRPALASPSQAPSKRQKVAPAPQVHSAKGTEPMQTPEEQLDEDMPPAESLSRPGAVSCEAAAVLPTAMDEMFTRQGQSVVNLTDIK